MGFFKNIVRNMADSALTEKLYNELPDFQAAYNYTNSEDQEVLLEGVINFLSIIIMELNKLTPDEKGRIGIEIYQGQIARLRSDNRTDAFSRWVIGTHLISQNMVSSEKQQQVLSWTTDIIEKSEKLCNPFN